MEKNKKQWMEQIANILHALIMKHPYSEYCASEIQTEDPFFIDSCNYVDLVYELIELERTLRNLIKYSDMSKGVDE